jgi:hypothetical protein
MKAERKPVFTTLAGTPATTENGGICIPSLITAPAAIIDPRPICAPFRMVLSSVKEGRRWVLIEEVQYKKGGKGEAREESNRSERQREKIERATCSCQSERHPPLCIHEQLPRVRHSHLCPDATGSSDRNAGRSYPTFINQRCVSKVQKKKKSRNPF